MQAKKQGLEYPLDRPCQVLAEYYMPNRAGWPDLVGLMQATADLLEEAGVLENDRLIYGWTETRIKGIDKGRPRVEIVIYPISIDFKKAYDLDPLVKGRLENGYYED